MSLRGTQRQDLHPIESVLHAPMAQHLRKVELTFPGTQGCLGNVRKGL
jgi:hypothetical protein